jgi:hypothetical protein
VCRQPADVRFLDGYRVELNGNQLALLPGEDIRSSGSTRRATSNAWRWSGICNAIVSNPSAAAQFLDRHRIELVERR